MKAKTIVIALLIAGLFIAVVPSFGTPSGNFDLIDAMLSREAQATAKTLFIASRGF